MRISRMEDLGGSWPPVKPSIYIWPPLGPEEGPARAVSSLESSSGSSESASRSLPVRTVELAFEPGSTETEAWSLVTLTTCSAVLDGHLGIERERRAGGDADGLAHEGGEARHGDRKDVGSGGYAAEGVGAVAAGGSGEGFTGSGREGNGGSGNFGVIGVGDEAAEGDRALLGGGGRRRGGRGRLLGGQKRGSKQQCGDERQAHGAGTGLWFKRRGGGTNGHQSSIEEVFGAG